MEIINVIISSSLKCELPIRFLRSSIRRNTRKRKPLNICQLLDATCCENQWSGRCIQLMQASRIAEGCNTTKPSETRTGLNSNISWTQLGSWGGGIYAASAGNFFSVRGYGYSHFSLGWHLASLGKQCFLHIKQSIFKCLLDMTISSKPTKSFYTVDSDRRDI